MKINNFTACIASFLLGSFLMGLSMWIIPYHVHLMIAAYALYINGWGFILYHRWLVHKHGKTKEDDNVAE
jgi:hypothetical protein